MNWIVAAVLAAVFAGVTSILAKLGVKSTDSDVATALRTTVVLVLAWAVAAWSAGADAVSASGVSGLMGTAGSANVAAGSSASSVFDMTTLGTSIAGVGFGLASSLATLSPRTWAFLILSGLATGGSWICYFKALSLGDANKVVPIDKSSAALSSLLAIVLFAEIDNLAIKLVCIAAIFVGTMMMIERKDVGLKGGPASGSWLIYAVLAAVFAAATALLGKVGIDGVESNLGTAIRTTVVLVVAWGLVFARGKAPQLKEIDAREGGFLVASGLATGASWLCYYYALQVGVVSVVVQIDKMSLLVSVLFAGLVLKERLTPRAAVGLGIITVFTLVMTVFA